MTNRFSGRLLRTSAARLAASAHAVQRALASAGGHNKAALLKGAGKQVDVAELLGRVLGKALPGYGAPPSHAEPAMPPGSAFLSASFTGSAGARPYRLFIPPHPSASPALIVMLHGCTQSAEDFAAGTRMNMVAANAGALVLYPVQVAGANAQRCWNWFNPADQKRDGGEAALIAEMTRMVVVEHRIDAKRVFAAGLSAGGAQAAILGAAYPDLFSAVGVHSGLACGAAADVGSAFAAMQHGRPGRGHHRMRTIIFHGDRDATVNVRNADAVADQVAVDEPSQTEQGQAPGGLAYTRTVQRDASGRPDLERWTVHGAGHAWSGGSTEGSYTEPRGPDASQAMVDFFLS